MTRESPKDKLIKALDDEALEHVTGGGGTDGTLCPLCRRPKENGVCGNPECWNYASYC